MGRRTWGVLAAVAVSTAGVAVPAEAGPTGGALPPQLTLVLHVAGQSGVPADAVGVAMNVTVTNPAAAGFLTVYPCGELPTVSNLNYVGDQTVPNLVIAALDADGDVCIDTMTVTDVVVDVAGYLPKGSSITPLPTPARFLDTREGIGAAKRRVVGGEVLSVPIAGRFTVPADASGVVANVTAVQPDLPGFLTVFPCGQGIPGTSSLNYTAGSIVPNLAISRLGGGSLCIYSPATTDVLVDVAAYLPAGGTGVTTLASPVRVVDTRTNQGISDGVLGTGIATLPVAGSNGVPSDATAAIVNLTAVGRAVPGFITAWPAGTQRPFTSNANFTANQVVANASVVPLGGGAISFASNTAVDMVVDITGYVSGPTSIVPITPTRLYDSRDDGLPRCNLGVLWNASSSTYEVVDTRTGSAAYPMPALPAYGLAHAAFIDTNDCHVYLAGVGFNTIVELDRAGRVVLTAPNNAFLASDNWMSAPGGPLAVTGDASTPQQIVDPFDGRVLASLPARGVDRSGAARLWRPIGVTRDGSLIAVANFSADLGNTLVYYSGAGTQLSTVPFGSDVPIGVSPDGTYLLVLSGAELRVTSLTGEVIASTPRTTFVTDLRDTRTGFAGDGEVFSCVGGRDSRWQLFSPPTPRSAVGCLVAAG